jgi:hypothetical protein
MVGSHLDQLADARLEDVEFRWPWRHGMLGRWQHGVRTTGIIGVVAERAAEPGRG